MWAPHFAERLTMNDTTAARMVILPCGTCGKLNRVNLARTDARALCSACRAPLTLDAPIVLTDGTFDQVVSNSAVPVIVDFYADWCGPCKAMAPVFAELARRKQRQAVVAKVDTDRNPNVSGRFGIRSIPTVTVLRNGNEVARQVGAVPMAVLEQLLSTS